MSEKSRAKSAVLRHGRKRGRGASIPGTPAAMMRSLRIKFVVASMTAITLVVAATFATICYLNYRQSVDGVYEQLQLATDAAFAPGRGHGWGRWGGGVLGELDDASAGTTAADGAGGAIAPEGSGEGQTQAAPYGWGRQQHGAAVLHAEDSGESAGEGGADEDSVEEEHPLPPQIGGGRHEGASIPVAVFLVDDAGQEAVALSGSTASLSTTVLAQALEELSEDGALAMATYSSDRGAAQLQQRGLLASLGLFYLARPIEGGFVVAFADASNASSWESLAALLAVVGLLVLAVFLVASIFFSRWALRPVERAWNQQQQFIADASHELKTPLTVILANMSIVKSQPQKTVAEQGQWMESTQVEAERMQGLVNDMLDLARPQQAPGLGSANSSELPVLDFSDLVEGEVLQFESVAFERGIVLGSRVEGGLMVIADEARLKRLTAILLDNACKYAEPPAAGVAQVLVGNAAAQPSDVEGEGLADVDGARIQVALARDGQFARLLVANTGPAIPADDLPHLFDRFYRVDKSRTKQDAAPPSQPDGRPGGFGLGLAIARDIAQACGGTIVAESTVEQGTVFIVRLPLA